MGFFARTPIHDCTLYLAYALKYLASPILNTNTTRPRRQNVGRPQLCAPPYTR